MKPSSKVILKLARLRVLPEWLCEIIKKHCVNKVRTVGEIAKSVRFRVRFDDSLQVANALDYDRTVDQPWKKLKRMDIIAIRRELNEFKSKEMAVHVDSSHMTRFH